MVANKNEIRVFYSWQSDLPKETNLNAIRNALNAAAKSVSKKIVLDEATRDTSGGVNIPKTILDKIDAADIFVADVSTIGTVEGGRKCPNPNVVFELGYAVATLGWERIILLFNLAHGDLADLPFDFDRHRATKFTLTAPPEKSQKQELEKLANLALSVVIRKDPKRPAELRGLSRVQIEHDRDVENLRWVLSTLHLPTVDQQILDLPHYIHERAIFHFEDFRSVVESSLFHLNDKKLLKTIIRFGKAWGDSLAHYGHYRDTPSGNMHVFHLPGDVFKTIEQKESWKAIESARKRMRAALDEVLDRVRRDYLEVDLKETNKKAHSDYIKFKTDAGASSATKKIKKARGERRREDAI